MKQVLITNFFFERYTGSELHVLELARLFKNKGYEVTIAVFRKGYPLLERIENFHVINVLKEELQFQDYDIVFVQHYPVFDYLCCKYNISYNKLIVSKLSVINELEYMPICTPDADLIVCVSEECANKVCEEMGDDSRIRVFKNSVSEDFFIAANTEFKEMKLRKIAIISNHVPEELNQLPNVMDGEYKIDYIGVQYSPRLVDAELLKEYDLVITIGRTVQQCFALKVPVFVYDYFGGPGYITDDNFVLAEKNNFSGRGFEKKTVLELKEEIINNYETNILNLGKLNNIAKKEYSYKTNFNQIYQELMLENNSEKKELRYYDEDAKKRMMMYGKATNVYAMPEQIVSQLYIDYGNGFNEADSIKWSANENYVITKTFETDKKVRGLRFDPCDVPAECHICNIYINGKIKEEYTGRRAQFLNFDSQFIIELSDEEKTLDKLSIQVSYKFNIISWDKTINLYGAGIRTLEDQIEVLKRELEESKNEINMLQETIRAVREYYKITPQNVIRRLLQFLKRKLKLTQDR